MIALVGHLMWTPEPLARSWWAIPTRSGFSVDMESPDEKREKWQLIASRRQLNSEVVEKLLSDDLSGVVITHGTAISIHVQKDWLQERDSSRSWWIEMTVRGKSLRQEHASQSSVVFRRDHSDLIMRSLIWSFEASGAERYDSDDDLLLCPSNFGNRWPSILLSPNMPCQLSSLSQLTATAAGETFICGRLKKILGTLAIFSGPAIDPATWRETVYLAFRPEGFLLRRGFINELTHRAIQNGAKRVASTRRVQQAGSAGIKAQE